MTEYFYIFPIITSELKFSSEPYKDEQYDANKELITSRQSLYN